MRRGTKSCVSRGRGKGKEKEKEVEGEGGKEKEKEKEKEMANWDPEIEKAFCEVCIQQVDAGHRINTYFSKTGWENVVSNFRLLTGRPYDKAQLKNKWDQLRRAWRLWKELLHGFTGLGWDNQLGTISATEEWWTARLKIVPSAAKFKKRGIKPEWEALYDRMFAGTNATGDNAVAAGESEEDNPGMDDLHWSGNSTTAPIHESPLDASTGRNKRPRAGATKQGFLRAQISQLAESSARDPEKIRRESVSRMYEALAADPEIRGDIPLYLFALTFLEDITRREIFCQMDVELRRGYLKRNYRPGSGE